MHEGMKFGENISATVVMLKISYGLCLPSDPLCVEFLWRNCRGKTDD